MPSWKKILISGSAGELSSLYAPSITGSLNGTASYAIYAATSSRSDITLSTQILVLNQSGYTIPKGLVVHITASGNSSDIPRVVSASYDSDLFSANTLGIATENITNGSQGFVITEGVLTGIDTSLFQSGQLIYLGTQGTITGSAPHAPLHSVRLGQVIREQSNNGSIHVRVDNGYELGELHDVTDATTSSSYGDLLVKSGSVWINSKQLTGSYGITGSLNFDIINAPNAYSNIFTGAGPIPISGSLSPGVGSAVWSYGTGTNQYNGLIIQTAGVGINDVGGLKITEDGVAIFGASDTDLLRVVDEDSNTQRFVINNSGQIGINKTSTNYNLTTPLNASLDVNGNAIISGSLTTTSAVKLEGLSNATSDNVVYIDIATGALSYGSGSSGSAVNIGNSDLTITNNTTRVLSHSGTSRLIISKSLDAQSVLELENATTSNSRMLYMKSKLNGESQRDSVRIITAAGNDADDSQFNGWMNEHIVEYMSGSAQAPDKLKGWSWSYYTTYFDPLAGLTPIYQDVLLISTSNAATLNASLKVTGSTYLTGLPAGTTSNVVYIDTTTGALSYGAGSSNAFPYTGSAQITGSLGVTGSLNFPSAISVNNASKIHVAKYPNPSGSLTAGVDSVLYNYGRSTEGLILQYRDQNFGDVGGLKITDTGVAIFGSGDNDVLKVINEDNNTQVFSINNSGYVGINKTGVSAQQTEANAYLDVNGTAIISGSFTTTSGVSLKGLSSATTSNVVYIDTTTGALSYGLAVSGSINISGSGNAFPYTGSAQITGSLGVTGSIGVSGNAPSVTILGNTASLAVTDVVKDNSTDIAPGYIGITGNAGHSPIVEKISYTTKPYYSPWFTAYDSDHPIDATYVASGSNGFDASAVLTNTVLNLRRYWGHNGTDYYAGFEELVRAGDPWDANNASADWFILLGSTGSIVPNVVLSITANIGKLWDNTTTGISSTNNYNQQCAITPQAVFGSDVKMLSDIQVQGKFVDSDASNTIDNKAMIQAGLLYLSNNF